LKPTPDPPTRKPKRNSVWEFLNKLFAKRVGLSLIRENDLLNTLLTRQETHPYAQISYNGVKSK
jgi:hypothetical protein